MGVAQKNLMLNFMPKHNGLALNIKFQDWENENPISTNHS